MNEWQPIETAPKEHRSYILYTDGVIVGTAVFWANEHGPPRWLTDAGEGVGCITHWQPLPEPPVRGWQPIETAPKDGTRVLLWREGNSTGEWPFMASWERGMWAIYIDGQVLRAATHWAPTPEPPE